LKARSTVARLVAKSTTYDDKCSTASDVLFQSAQLLLQKGQIGSGTDLALYMIELWTTKEVPCGDSERGRLWISLLVSANRILAKVTQLIALAGRSETWRASIINAAVK
jgi:hypothetical protein